MPVSQKIPTSEDMLDEAVSRTGLSREQIEMAARVVYRVAVELGLDVLSNPRARGEMAERMTFREVSEVSGLSVKTIRRKVNEGMLRVRYPMGSKKFHRDDVDRFLRGMKWKRI